MTKEELEQELMLRVVQIKDLYENVYPQGRYLDICIVNNSIFIVNDHDEDKDYLINLWKEFKC